MAGFQWPETVFSRKSFILPIVRSPLASQLTPGCKPLGASGRNNPLIIKNQIKPIYLRFN